MKVQNSYPKEFKDSTVQLALNSEKSVLEIGNKISDRFIGLKLGEIKRETKNIEKLKEVFI